MPITNGFDEARVLPALAIRMGWLQPTDSNYPVLSTANKASASGRYYNDDSFHAACTIQNLYDCQPDSGISAEEFNAYLQQLQKGVLLGMLNAIFGEARMIETGMVYGKCSNEAYRYIGGNRFCGIAMTIADGNHAVMLNEATLMMNEDVDFTLYLYHELKGKLKEWEVSAKANELTTVALNEAITSMGGSGKWFLGYYQDALGTAKAIDYSTERNVYRVMQTEGMEAAKTGAATFDLSNYTSTETMYGLNLRASAYRDMTAAIINNAHLLDELGGLSMAAKVIDIVLNSTRSNRNQRIVSEQQKQYLASELNRVAGAQSAYSPGLKARIAQEVERVSNSFFPKQPKAQTINLYDTDKA
jgi:hypothetical protein